MTLERRKEKEQRELTRLRQINQKPETAKYIKWIFILVILVHVIDEIASNCAAYVQSSVVNDYFVVGQGMTYENGLAVLASFSGVTLLLQLVAPFYKSLADRFGRKPFLVVNTYGMALGLGLCFVSKSFGSYIVGTMITTFFIAHDMQVVYILEVAPSDKRTRFYGITKCIGTLGLALVPLFRGIFMGDDPTKWRMVFFVPVLIAIAIATLCLLTARETKVYLAERISVLERPLEERLAEKEAAKEKKKSSSKVGMWATIKLLLGHHGRQPWPKENCSYHGHNLHHRLHALCGGLQERLGRNPGRPSLRTLSWLLLSGWRLHVDHGSGEGTDRESRVLHSCDHASVLCRPVHRIDSADRNAGRRHGNYNSLPDHHDAHIDCIHGSSDD